MNLLGKVRRLHYRDGLNLSEIERRTGLTRKTIRKWLKAPEGVEPNYRRKVGETKIGPFAERLVKMLEMDARRPVRDRRTALKLHAELKQLGFDGDYSRVTEFIRKWREGGGAAVTKAFVPLQFAPGEAHQFDWSEEHLIIGGVWRKLTVAHLKLCYSKTFVIQAYPAQSHEMLFDAHARAFAALGGIPRRGIYDNMKTAVDKVKKGKARVVNTRFAAMASHYLFDPDFCNVASGWEKGVVEKNVQDSRRRIWQEAGTLRFGSFAELNAWLLARCQALWQEVRHPEYALSVAEMLEHEQPHLMPMVSAFDGYVEEPGRVSSTCLVTAARNHYSVPCELAGKLISKRFYPERIEVVFDEVVMASHPRLFERGQTRYDWRHYLPLVERKPGVLRNGAPFAEMPEPLVRLQRLLLRREGGDRVMSQMLAVVPKAGLDTVLVAVELVLESGVVSVEHVLNVIARLNQAPLPESVPTTLQVKEAPVADTGRYDRLRTQEADHA